MTGNQCCRWTAAFGDTRAGLGADQDCLQSSLWRRAGERDTDLPVRERGQCAEFTTKKACRVNGPSPKLRRDTAIQREIRRIVPAADPQACRANACGSWAFLRSLKWRREFGQERTGACEGIRTLDPNLGKDAFGLTTINAMQISDLAGLQCSSALLH
jgi:hypothetical protein